MTKEEFIDDFEEKQAVAMAKLDAYRKVIDSVKRMYESSERREDLGISGGGDLGKS